VVALSMLSGSDYDGGDDDDDARKQHVYEHRQRNEVESRNGTCKRSRSRARA